MYDLRRGKQAQTYGIGVKEVWCVEEGKHFPGSLSFPPSLLFSLLCFFIQHLAGKVHALRWPPSAHTYGGGWEYHMADGHVSIRLVVGLAYKNPYIGPYREFQHTKHHPHFHALLANSTRLAYGAHSLQSLPRLDSPGRRWLAAAVNTAEMEGTRNAMQVCARLSPAFYPSHPLSTFLPFILPPFYTLFP
ncbi:hypothetical protein K438DRAFT_1992748 [Mycena galopus ATCC 62051]|nr:hypothetical protein K438DRAFT_1992748 [Mycena galopus ATCC 62051]